LSSAEGVTGHAITFITPDKERTFATCQGVSEKIFKSSIDLNIFNDLKVLHVEGYMFANQKLASVIEYFIAEAFKRDVKISIDLADASIIKKKKKYLQQLLSSYASYLFLNKDELFEYTSSNRMDAALQKISQWHSFVIVKLGEEGSVVIHDNESYKIDADKIKVCNTNGAGDIYVAGFLYGVLNKYDIRTCGKIASYCASQVVQVTGARLKKNIEIEKSGLI
jgi:sugar/nucleoside kinase (ribokinase family)